MIQLEGIHKRFGGVEALEDVSLQLHPGQVHCLAGANGSGKSTLIKVLAGVLRPDRGTLTMDQESFSHLTPIESVRQGIQVIYQDLSLFPNLSVAENLAFNRLLEGRVRLVQRRQMQHIARQALERLGISLPLNAMVGQLSVAQKQLIAIARALVQDARIIVLDEPTTALTHLEVEALLQILANLRDRGVAILFVSHQLREMGKIADYYTILRGGQVVAKGPADRFPVARLAHCMTGRRLKEDRQPAARAAAGRILLEAIELKNDCLHGVSLKVRAGERLGLTGLLGAGQTALALALFGLQPYHSGQIFWRGRPLSIKHVRAALDAGIAYVPEDRLAEGLFLDQSIRSNLIAAAMKPACNRLGLLTPDRLQRHAEHWRAQLSIAAPNLSAAVSSLSGGNGQRVVLAKWLSRGPKLLILNGPTVGVDIGSKESIHEMLGQLAASGMGILMISDDLSELARHCDRVLIMHRGLLAKELAGDDLTSQAISATLNSLE